MRIANPHLRLLKIGGVFIFIGIIFTFLIPIHIHTIDYGNQSVGIACDGANIQKGEDTSGYDAATKGAYHLLLGEKARYDRSVTFAETHKFACVPALSSYKLYL
jgi:hypothetical protein